MSPTTRLQIGLGRKRWGRWQVGRALLFEHYALAVGVVVDGIQRNVFAVTVVQVPIALAQTSQLAATGNQIRVIHDVVVKSLQIGGGQRELILAMERSQVGLLRMMLLQLLVEQFGDWILLVLSARATCAAPHVAATAAVRAAPCMSAVLGSQRAAGAVVRAPAASSAGLPTLCAPGHHRPSLDAPRSHWLGTELPAVLVAPGIAQPQAQGVGAMSDGVSAAAAKLDGVERLAVLGLLANMLHWRRKESGLVLLLGRGSSV